MAWYSLLANLIVVIHLAYVSYVLVGLLLILAGIVRRWQWIRNVWFRVSHLIMILIVVGEEIGDVECPLTRWELALRASAGQEAREGAFVGELLHNLFHFDWADWVFTTIYFAMALLVLATLWLAPPRLKRKTPTGEPAA